MKYSLVRDNSHLEQYVYNSYTYSGENPITVKTTPCANMYSSSTHISTHPTTVKCYSHFQTFTNLVNN